ncbi:MAG TPA: DUF2231 domain-containing protein [Ktedonobacteraceae bacterium]|nr:DUF2231 domain-containing protein [Ktedonobacteraceae bacterium]
MCETCGCQSAVSAVSTSDVTPETASSETSSMPQPFVERLSDSLQHIISVVVGAQRKPPRRLKSMLNGTWVGHPLHPVITDVPVGSWMLTAVFDIIWLIAPTSFAWAARAAEVTVVLGLLGALGAIVTGLTDWSDTYGSERKVGLYHGMFNAIATLLYVASLILRLQTVTGGSIIAAILGFLGLIAVLIAGFLGGEMVFNKGTGVNRTAWEAGSDQYEAVLPLEQVEEKKLYRVMASGVPVVLIRQGMQFHAISATCPHAGGPLDEGKLEGDVVECPWHGSRFCMSNGRVLTGPATVNAPRYDVRVRDGMVEVKRLAGH